MRDEKLSRGAAHQSTKQDSRVATRGYTAQKTMPEHRQIEAVKKFGRLRLRFFLVSGEEKLLG